MTDKEMHKLSRRELLQLLLTQGRETEKLKQMLSETEGQLEQLSSNYERLKKRLDYKDDQIHDLKETLHRERTNRQIELAEAGSIAEASLRLNGVFEVAQKAAEQYLYNIRLMYDKKKAELEGDEDGKKAAEISLKEDEEAAAGSRLAGAGAEDAEAEESAEGAGETEETAEENGIEKEGTTEENTEGEEDGLDDNTDESTDWALKEEPEEVLDGACAEMEPAQAEEAGDKKKRLGWLKKKEKKRNKEKEK